MTEAQAVAAHLVDLIQRDPDVRYFVGGFGSHMRELLLAFIVASGHRGDPVNLLQPPRHRADEQPRHVRLQERIDELEREVRR